MARLGGARLALEAPKWSKGSRFGVGWKGKAKVSKGADLQATLFVCAAQIDLSGAAKLAGRIHITARSLI